MNRIANGDAREYRSDLREEQAMATRERILDATVRVMAGGLADVTVPAVARAAGVSVPTVYRHFGTKRNLLAALQPYLQQRAGIDSNAFPRGMGEVREHLVALLDGMEGIDDVLRAALASRASDQVRRVHAPNRFNLARRFVDGIAPDLSEADRDRVARLLMIMTASPALRMWREDFAASIEEIAGEIDQALRALIGAARERAVPR